MGTRIKRPVDPGLAAAAARIAAGISQSNSPSAHDDGGAAYHITSATRPIDPAVAAAAAGRVVAARIAQSSNSRRRRGRPQRARAPPDDHDDDEGVDAFSIPAFCRRHGISESFYHKLRVLGLGPATMRVGKRVLISAEEAARWRAERTAASSTTPGDAA